MHDQLTFPPSQALTKEASVFCEHAPCAALQVQDTHEHRGPRRGSKEGFSVWQLAVIVKVMMKEECEAF